MTTIKCKLVRLAQKRLRIPKNTGQRKRRLDTCHPRCTQSRSLGVAAIFAKTRRRYWIIKGSNLAKMIKGRCTFCREMEAKAETQLLANLPSCRLQPCTPPFLYTSCDYFGPVKVQVGRAHALTREQCTANSPLIIRPWNSCRS